MTDPARAVRPQIVDRVRRLGLPRAARRRARWRAQLPHPRRRAPAEPRRQCPALRLPGPDPRRAGESALPGIGRARGRRRRCVVNLVGILRRGAARPSRPSTPTARRPWPRRRAAAGARMIHVSALGADLASRLGLCAHARRKARSLVRAARPDAVILRPSRDVRPWRQLLQPLRRARPHAAGAAARRCRHALPAGLCRRRRRGDRPRRRRRGAGRARLRARRAGDADPARARRNTCSRRPGGAGSSSSCPGARPLAGGGRWRLLDLLTLGLMPRRARADP